MSRVLSDASTYDIGTNSPYDGETRYTNRSVLSTGNLRFCSGRVLHVARIFQKMHFSVKRHTDVMYIVITNGHLQV